MGQAPRVTVLMPVFNGERFLHDSVESILAQRFADFEFIIVDDGSTDGTRGMLDDWAQRDRRLVVRHEAHRGLVEALNVGARMARGEYIARMDADDFSMPERLGEELRVLDADRSLAIVGSAYVLMDETGREQGVAGYPSDDTAIRWRTLFRSSFAHTSVMFRTALMHERQLWYRDLYKHSEDYDLWSRMLRSGRGFNFPEPLVKYRRHESQMMRVQAAERAAMERDVSYENLRALGLGVSCSEAAELHALYCGTLAGAPHLQAAAFVRLFDVILAFERQPGLDGQFVERLRREYVERAGTVRASCNWEQSIRTGLALRLVKERWRVLRCRAVRSARLRVHRPDSFLRDAKGRTADVAGRVVFVCQHGSRLTDEVRYGTMRATLERAKYVMRSGYDTLLLGVSDRPAGTIEGVPFLGAADERAVRRKARALRRRDLVVGISRADIFRWTRTGRWMIYHHGPHPVPGAPAFALNWVRVPVVCVSEHSRAAQAGYGIRHALLHVVPNGCSAEAFRAMHVPRRPHALVFAGQIVDYKGADVALRAFELLRRRFPDATLDIYGRCCSWENAKEQLFAPEWLDAKGWPIWAAVERDLPGVRYRDEAPPEKLARAFSGASLLVMPSRIPETFGIASLEAQACGCIPVLPRIGGFPETLRERETGWLYDRNTPEGLAEIVTRLWQEGRPTDAERREAQRWVRENFSWEKSGAAFLDLVAAAPMRTFWRRRLFDGACWMGTIARPMLPVAARGRQVLRRLRTTPPARWPDLFRSRLKTTGKRDSP